MVYSAIENRSEDWRSNLSRDPIDQTNNSIKIQQIKRFLYQIATIISAIALTILVMLALSCSLSVIAATASLVALYTVTHIIR